MRDYGILACRVESGGCGLSGGARPDVAETGVVEGKHLDRGHAGGSEIDLNGRPAFCEATPARGSRKHGLYIGPTEGFAVVELRFGSELLGHAGLGEDATLQGLVKRDYGDVIRATALVEVVEQRAFDEFVLIVDPERRPLEGEQVATIDRRRLGCIVGDRLLEGGHFIGVQLMRADEVVVRTGLCAVG